MPSTDPLPAETTTGDTTSTTPPTDPPPIDRATLIDLLRQAADQLAATGTVPATTT